jgi:hypothetical protein
MSIISRRRLRVLWVAAASITAMSPVSFSPDRGVVPLEACADGTCCDEDRSLCFINGIKVENAYKNGSGGSCAVIQT